MRPGDADLELEADGQRLLVTLHGELDLGTVPALEDRLREALAAGARVVVVDLEAVTFLDSTGTSLLFRLAQESTTRRRDFAVVAPPGCVAHRLLDMVSFRQAAPVLEARPA